MTHASVTKLLAVPALTLCMTMACDEQPGEPSPGDVPWDERERPQALAEVSAPVGAAADCCASDTAPGCSDVAVASCVCDADPYCCTTAWDAVCVNEVATLGCGSCDTVAPCCTTSTGPGCEAPSIESCVCAADSYCCSTAWDGLCVSEVQSLGCGSCDAVDLVITALELPAVACPGEDIAPSVVLELRNVGSGDVSTMFSVGWYLSDDAILDAGDRLLVGGRDQVASLAAGASTMVSIGVDRIPSDASPGPRHIIVSVDEFDVVVETDEANDVVAVPIEIQPACEHEWAHGIGGPMPEAFEPGDGVAVDADGNVYVLGIFRSPTLDLGHGPMVLQGERDLFLVSYDADGLLRWSRYLGGDSRDNTGGIGVDAAGNVYVAGETDGSLDAGGGEPLPSAGPRDLFVASYTSTGAYRWSQRHGAPGTRVQVDGLAADDAGNVVVVGYIDGPVSLGGAPLPHAGSYDGFVLALDGTGGHRWSRSFGAPGTDVVHGVAVDDVGGALVSGAFSHTVGFDAESLVSAGATDGMLVRLDGTGATQWARRFGAASWDSADDAILDAAGNAYLIGTFSGTVDLGDGPRVAAGLRDVVLASYAPAGTFRWSRQVGGAGTDDGWGIDIGADGHLVATGAFAGEASFGGPILAGGGVWYASYATGGGAHRWSSRLGSGNGLSLASSPTGALVLAGQYTADLSIFGTTLDYAGQKDVYVISVRP